MNAAAKMMHQGNFFSGHLTDIRLSASFFLFLLLLLALFLSALAVVYSTNLYRVNFSQLETAQQQSHHLQVQWGQLLLEQASLATPARVQHLATQQLGMVLPTDKQVQILRLK